MGGERLGAQRLAGLGVGRERLGAPSPAGPGVGGERLGPRDWQGWERAGSGWGPGLWQGPVWAGSGWGHSGWQGREWAGSGWGPGLRQGQVSGNVLLPSVPSLGHQGARPAQRGSPEGWPGRGGGWAGALTPGDDLAVQLVADQVKQPEDTVVKEDEGEAEEHVTQDADQGQAVTEALAARQERGACARREMALH